MPVVPLTDPADEQLAPYRNLTTKNLTRQSGLFIAEGEKVVQRLIDSRFAVASLLAERPWAERLAPRLPPETPVFVADRPLIEQIAGFHFHRGVLACGVRQAPAGIEQVVPRDGRTTLVVCPDINDPTNLGTILRTSAGLGVDAVMLGPQSADPFSRRVIRVSMGAVFRLPLVESANLRGDLQRLRDAGVELCATVLAGDAEPLDQFQRGERLALLLGSEGHGLAPQWLELCARQLTLPMRHGVDSLNVAVAAGIFLYEAMRGRRE